MAGMAPIQSTMRMSRHLGLSRWIVGAVTAAGLTMTGLVAAPAALGDVTVPTTFSYETGAPTQQYPVPAGITQVTITADGGSGAAAAGGTTSQPGGTGGVGGEVTATVPVTPSETLNVVVGGDAGADGNTCSGDDAASCGGPGAGPGGNSGNPAGGGGGGGASQVSDASNSPLVVAAGGGGGGGTIGGVCDISGGAGGAGGAAASDGTTAPTCTGSGSIGLGTSHGGGGGGAGATTTGGSAGAGGTGTGCDSNLAGGDGNAATGPAGADGVASSYPEGQDEAGGAGGGGLFGGGSGGSGAFCLGSGDAFEAAGAGGGGGGANFTAASGTDVTVGTSGRSFGSNGQVTISYTQTTPVITSPVSGSTLPTGTVSQSYSTTITATGMPAPTFTASGLPAGLSIDANTGVISGTPATAGSFAVTVTATNAAGDDTATYTLPVAATTTATVVGTPGPVPAGSSVTLTATVSPAPAVGTVAFSLNGNPISACGTQPVDPSTGTATCSVTAPDKASSYPVAADYSGGDGYDSSSGSATLTVTAGTLSSLALSPATASITAGGSQAYTATGYDTYGNSLGDVTAQTTFAISGSGSCTGATCTATTGGTYTVTGTDGTATGTASLTVTAGQAATLTISGGNDQSAATGKAFATPLSVTVTDADSNPVPGAKVTFTITPDTGGTANFGGTTQTVTVIANSAGAAAAPTLYAGTTAGPVAVTATTPGASGPVGTTFMETVTSTAPHRADLAIGMRAPSRLAPRARGTISITVTNKGPQAASKVLTLLYVPYGLAITGADGGNVRGRVDLFTASTLAAGHKLTYTVHVRAGFARARVRLFAGTGSATRDPNLRNNIAVALLIIT
jgi:hypothetical protein